MISGSGAISPAPSPGSDDARVREVPRDELPRDLVHAAWEERFPGLVCGITTVFDADYGLSRGDAGSRLVAFASLGKRLGFEAVAVGRQVHGSRVRVLRSESVAGVLLADNVDGWATTSSGWLLAATAADCVPVYLFDPFSGALGLLHAGWRGTADRILRRGTRAMSSMGAALDSVHIHLGPAICGMCYEVDEPVLHALGLPGDRARVDLRAVLSEQAKDEGIAGSRISISSWCTRCSEGLLHSHRARGLGAGRMAAYLGRRGSSEGGSHPAP